MLNGCIDDYLVATSELNNAGNLEDLVKSLKLTLISSELELENAKSELMSKEQQMSTFLFG